MGSSHAMQVRKIFEKNVGHVLNKSEEEDIINKLSNFREPKKIIAGMYLFENNLYIQRAGSKQLSNLAFDMNNVELILNEGGVRQLIRSMRIHINDWKLCWFSASAVWNMARPQVSRIHIGKSIKLLINMLKLHNEQERVVHTVIGALSNLSLESANADKIISGKNLDIIFNTIYKHIDSNIVLTSSYGLIANLAIREEVAQQILKYDVIQLILDGLKLLEQSVSDHIVDEQCIMFYENSMAALSNMTFVEDFKDHFLIGLGVESLSSLFQNSNNLLTDESDISLLRNILNNIGISLEDAQDINYKLYSLHQLVKMVDTIYDSEHKKSEMINIMIHKQEHIINEKDGNNFTPLDYAIANDDKNSIKLLIKSGAKIDKKSIVKCKKDIHDLINETIKHYNSLITQINECINNSSNLIPDLSKIVINYLSKYELNQVFSVLV